MKIVLSVVAIVVLMIGCFTSGKTSAQSAFALTQYQLGHKHGCNDADKLPGTNYINSIGHEASHHTAEFMNGYHQGFKTCAGSEAQDTSDFPELKPGEHWGECEERSVGLVCDILNYADYDLGHRQGVTDANSQHLPGNGLASHTMEFNQGYIDGFCSIIPNARNDNNESTWDCSQASGQRNRIIH
jgi:hypothetical protein